MINYNTNILDLLLLRESLFLLLILPVFKFSGLMDSEHLLSETFKTASIPRALSGSLTLRHFLLRLLLSVKWALLDFCISVSLSWMPARPFNPSRSQRLRPDYFLPSSPERFLTQHCIGVYSFEKLGKSQFTCQ